MEQFAFLTNPLFILAGMPMSIGDLLGFVTGLLCVWLTARANVWNFPTGILNSAILGFVFLQQRLFADASLQIVFIVLSALGWRQWLRRQHAEESSPVFPTTLREQLTLLGIGLAVTLILWQILVALRGASPPVDALITAFSMCAQWQLNRRQVSNWVWWIAVDVISIPLYWSRDLPLIAALYVVFLLICLNGLRRWRMLAQPRMVGAAA